MNDGGVKPGATGGCQCGAVRYRLAARPLEVYVCHCRECRRQSASAFGISVIVQPGDLELVAGEPAVWTRPATVDGMIACSFCPRCGSRLWHGDRAGSQPLSVKGGSLDAPPDIAGARHIWVSRKLAGVVIPDGAETWPEEPPS